MLAFIAVMPGFSYGGFLGVFPALDGLWGFSGNEECWATIYGMILLGFGIGAVVSSYVVAYFSVAGRSHLAFAIAGAAAVAGLAIKYLGKGRPRSKDWVKRLSGLKNQLPARFILCRNPRMSSMLMTLLYDISFQHGHPMMLLFFSAVWQR